MAKTVDLMVPAHAEIIIEREVIPGETAPEGPFGEFADYMGPESTTIQSLVNAGVILKLLHDLGETGVCDVHIDLTFGGLLGHVMVAMTPHLLDHRRRVGRLICDLTPLKRVTVSTPMWISAMRCTSSGR